jgi:hypothetical protein
MLRALACALAMLALMETAAVAEEVSDANNTFRLTIPDGWTKVPPPFAGVALIVASPRIEETGGSCNVIIAEVEETRSMTQAEAEALAIAAFTEEAWKAEIASIRFVKSVTIEQSGVKEHRGRKAFFVRAIVDFDLNGTVVSFKNLQDFHVIPGRMYAVTCASLAAAYDQEAADLETIMASFEPIPSMTVAGTRARAPSTVTAAAIAHAMRKAASDALQAAAMTRRTR